MYGILQEGAVVAEFVAPLDFVSNQPVFSADALSLKRSTSVSPSQRWELECRLEPLTWSANNLFVMFTTKGRHAKWELRVPQNTGVIRERNSSSSVHTVNGLKGDTALGITRWSGTTPAGTFIRFANHSKIYMLTKDLGPGDMTMHIYPPLRKSQAGETFLHQDDVVMEAWLDTDGTRGMKYTDGILMDMGTVKFVEAL